MPDVFVEVAVDGGAFFDSHRLDGGAASEGALAARGDRGVLNRNRRLAKRTDGRQQRRPLGQRLVRFVFQIVSDGGRLAEFREGRLQVEGVGVLFLQTEQALVEALDYLGLRLVGGLIVYLQWVALDVVQARLGDFWVKDQLPVADGHGTLKPEVGTVHGLDFGLLLFAIQQRHEALELDLFRALGPGDVERGGHHVL